MFLDGWVQPEKPEHHFSDGYSADQLNEERRLYDEYIAYVDSEFGRFYDNLKTTGLLENTYFILTSDHGQLFERGIHGHITSTLYESLIHVPLLIARPGQRGREDIFSLTSCTDLLPTLLHATGKTIPDWIEGKVLPTFGGGDEEYHERVVYSVEARTNPKFGPLEKGTVALLKGEYKLIHYFGYDGFEDQYELYNLKKDPDELDDIFEKIPAVGLALKEVLFTKLETE